MMRTKLETQNPVRDKKKMVGPMYGCFCLPRVNGLDNEATRQVLSLYPTPFL